MALDSQEIKRLIQNDSTLKTLVLEKCCLYGDKLESIIQALKKNTCLKELNLGFNRLGLTGTKKVSEILEFNSTLISLELAHNELGNAEIEELAKGLRNNNSLTYLGLSRNNITNVLSLAKALELNSRSIELALEFNNISNVSGINLLLQLNCNLSLADNPLDIENLKLLIPFTPSEQQNYLDISCVKKLNPFTFTPFFKTLASNTNLTGLDLCSNRIGNAELKILTQSLSVHNRLKWLNLSNNHIDSEGAKCIAETLKRNTSLKLLNLEGNAVSDKGVKYLCKVLSNNSKLRELNLGNNWIKQEGISYLTKNTSHLKALGLSFNDIGDKGAREVADMLKVSSLKRISFWGRIPLKASTSVYIIQALELNYSLLQAYIPEINDQQLKKIINRNQQYFFRQATERSCKKNRKYISSPSDMI